MLLAALAAMLTLSAADTPNFTGDWKMNASKSDFGQMPPPDKFERKITHEGDKLTSVTTQAGQMGEFTNEAKYVIDGNEHVNKTRMGEVKSVLKWDGKVLVITSKLQFQGNDVTSVDRWSLSEDGKTLTSDSTFSSSMGEMTRKTVLEKK
jgi:hypothetical protein